MYFNQSFNQSISQSKHISIAPYVCFCGEGHFKGSFRTAKPAAAVHITVFCIWSRGLISYNQWAQLAPSEK